MTSNTIQDYIWTIEVSGTPGGGIEVVEIDVQPNDPDNFVGTDGNFSDKIYLSVEGSASFDATQVDASTVRFGPAAAAPHTTPGDVVDTNHDGIDDMRLKFRIVDLGISD